MAELRYNPLLKDWTMVAASRQNRPHMPKDFVRFARVPEKFLITMMFIYIIMTSRCCHRIHRSRMPLVEACIKQEKRMGNVKWFCIHPATTIPSRIFHGSI